MSILFPLDSETLSDEKHLHKWPMPVNPLACFLPCGGGFWSSPPRARGLFELLKHPMVYVRSLAQELRLLWRGPSPNHQLLACYTYCAVCRALPHTPTVVTYLKNTGWRGHGITTLFEDRGAALQTETLWYSSSCKQMDQRPQACRVVTVRVQPVQHGRRPYKDNYGGAH